MKKADKVIAAMEAGMILRPQAFSRKWELVWDHLDKSGESVSRAVVLSLVEDGRLVCGLREGDSRSSYIVKEQHHAP